MQVQAHIVALGVKAFEALFSQDPYLLKLFPFKDEHGVPIMHELEVHALKVFSTFGTVVEGLDNMTTTGQALDALVKCACSSPFLHLLTDAGTVQCVEDLSTACSVCCMQLGHVQADHLCLLLHVPAQSKAASASLLFVVSQPFQPHCSTSHCSG